MTGGNRWVVAAFVVLIVFWGSSFLFVEIGLRSSPPLLFAGMRCVIGGLALIGLALVRDGVPDFRREWTAYALLAVFNVLLFIGLQTYAVLELPSGSAAVLVYLQPILVGVLAWWFLGEALTAIKILGLVLGFSGIAVVSLGGISGGIEDGLSGVGVFYGAASALAWASGTVLFKRFQGRVSPLWSVAAPFVIGGIGLCAIALTFESPADIAWSAGFIGSLAYSSLLGISSSWFLWFTLVGMGEASRVSAYIFVVPLMAVVIGVVVLGEPLHATLIAGAALVVGGIYLVNRSPVTSVRKGA